MRKPPTVSATQTEALLHALGILFTQEAFLPSVTGFKDKPVSVTMEQKDLASAYFLVLTLTYV